MTRHRYLPDEDARLTALYQGNASHAQIAAALGRSAGSVAARIRKLRIAALRSVPTKVQRRPGSAACRTGITKEDLAWMHYWRQPRAVRLAQERRR